MSLFHKNYAIDMKARNARVYFSKLSILRVSSSLQLIKFYVILMLLAILAAFYTHPASIIKIQLNQYRCVIRKQEVKI